MKKEWDLSSQKLGILLQNFADMILSLIHI